MSFKSKCINLAHGSPTDQPKLTSQQQKQIQLEKAHQTHDQLLKRYRDITNYINLDQKKKKKKKKKNRRKVPQFQWWGLAQSIDHSKRYRLPPAPMPVKSQDGPVKLKPALQLQNRISKLQNFKRKLFEQQIENIQRLERQQIQKENVGCYSQGLIPKLNRLKVKVEQNKPLTVNTVQKMKKKLLDYAKNGQIFVDRLQLQ